MRSASFAILCLLFASSFAVNDVIVKYNKLFVDNKEYIVKGMAYNPAPLTFNAPVAAGLCSTHQDFVDTAQYPSACYDSDFFDGYTYPGHPYPVPADGWFSALWERDLPQMAAMGVNTLRVYNVNPSNYLAYVNYKGQYQIGYPGKDHRPFLDACAANNIKVVWPLFSDVTYLTTFPEERLQFYMRTAIEEAGNHSAILMYALGNELNYVNGSDYNSWVNVLGIASRLINYARDYQRTYWGRMIPFTTGTDDNNNYYNWLAGLLPVDVFMPNAGYRGQPANNIWNFYDLWSGSPSQNFSGWYALSCKYQIPLLIGEMNPLGYQNPAPGLGGPYPTGFPQLWQDLMTHVSQGAIGGFFFEWNDEPWKAFGSQDQLGLHTVTVACNGTRCSDQENVLIADTFTQKGWEWDAVATGAVAAGTKYSYGTDPFTLLGRAAQTLGTASNQCGALWDGTFPVHNGGGGSYVSQYSLYTPTTPSPSGTTASTTTSTTATTQPPASTPSSTTPAPTTTGTASPSTSPSSSPSPSPSPTSTSATTRPPSTTTLTASPSTTTIKPSTTGSPQFTTSPASTLLPVLTLVLISLAAVALLL